MKVVLVGYMASGKSSVGKLLAEQMDMKFIDLDDYIEQEAQASIKTIFAEKGEIFFRKMEHQMLGKVLEENGSIVLSTGGGTPCYANNMQTILEKSDYSIYLHATIPELVARISREKESRPLVRNLSDEELPEFIGKHLFERRQFYALAKHTVDSTGKSLEEVTEEIKKQLL